MRRQLGYRHLLAGVVVLYLIIIVAPAGSFGAPLRVAMSGALLIVAVHTRRRAGSWNLPAIALATVLIVATIAALGSGSNTALECTSQAATVILVVATIVIIGQTLLAYGTIDGPAVRGVLCVYLLLGLLFSSLNNFFIPLIPNYLNGAGSHPSTSDTLYFSLITLTTVGYGDIVPVSNVARAVSAVEALTGQLYLVSIVAAVVARYQPKRRPADTQTSPDEASPEPRPADGSHGPTDRQPGPGGSRRGDRSRDDSPSGDGSGDPG